MQRDIVIKGRSLGGCSDLTLLAPIKPGFIEALESMTYKTRIKSVLDTLHGGRKFLHEYAWAQLASDAVERVGAIHSVRVAVLEPEDKVLLAVTFDGSWESYIRVLWDKVGTLLDLIFCGTVDYVTAWDHSFDEWVVWARRVQIETGFFYGPPEFTARDSLYERRISGMRERGAATDLSSARLDELRAVLPLAEEGVERLANPPRPFPADEPPVLQSAFPRLGRERIRSGLEGLAALYSLVDLHRPGTDDGNVLRRASIDLLREFVSLRNSQAINDDLEKAKNRFARQLAWLFPVPPEVRVENLRIRPDPPEARADPGTDPEIQGGILRTYDGVTHGVLLLVGFASPAAAKDLFDWLDGRTTKDSDSHVAVPNSVFVNVGFTLAGLRAIGVDENGLDLFPEEFRQGMAARAGSLGDIRNNHPRRWRLPRRFVTIDSDPANEAVEIDAVHAVVQLRCFATGKAAAAFELKNQDHPLRGAVATLIAALPDHSVLAVQPLVRRYEKRQGLDVAVEPFGYADGNGQPDIAARNPPFRCNRVLVGEFVLGNDNTSDFAIDESDPLVPERNRERARWLKNGSFLVMRKYRQFADRLATAVAEAAAEMQRRLGGSAPDYVELVYAKLMGRWRDGVPVTDPSAPYLNFFGYGNDEQGARCPLHAHIRRANPRLDPDASPRLPRLMRRGMSYGPATDAGEADRGIVFMAFNASLGEQFEVVQRWLAGGNSTGSTSGQSCPIVGVAEGGLARSFAFEHAGQSFSVKLDDDTLLFNEPLSPTRLEWGLYLFTPSLSVLHRLKGVAATAAAIAPVVSSEAWKLERGRALLSKLRQIEHDEGSESAIAAWKNAIEDPNSIDRLCSASLWAAIRTDHAGLLRTSYGVFVADRDLVGKVFLDPESRYSVCGQLERMKRSFGEISLGMDAGPVYELESAPINDAIGQLTEADAFDLARDTAKTKIDDIVSEAIDQANKVGDPAFEVDFEAREVLDEVLAALSQAWFGLNDDPEKRFCKGGSDWQWKRGQPPLYPGHFTAMSRYMFQPNPGRTVIELGEGYGQALREAMRLFVGDHRLRHTKPQRPPGGDAPIAAAAFDHKTGGGDDDFVARTMVGVLMGFNPTIIGAVVNVLREWYRDGSFGVLRIQLGGRTTLAAAHEVIDEPMKSAARARPMPQLAWRTVKKAHRLGAEGPDGVDLEPGDKVVLAIVSGTQQSLADGCLDDGRLMFGGVRPPKPKVGPQPPHPTHACPGYVAGIGAMLGTLTALLARTEDIRPGTAALSFVMSGACGGLAQPKVQALGAGAHSLSLLAPAPAVARLSAIHALRNSKFLTVTASKLVVGWGDSWLDNPYPRIPGPFDTSDLLQELKNSSRSIDAKFCVYDKWGHAQQLAANTKDFCDHLGKPECRNATAILLSAGGDDSTGSALEKMLLSYDPANTSAINEPELTKHINLLTGYYETIVKAIRAVNKTIPIVVHGYDHPLPRGKGPFPSSKDWLLVPFINKKYDPNRDMTMMTKGMARLIEALNDDMFAKLKDVTYIDLRNTISKAWGANEGDHWFDDLHPLDDAFALMANKLVAAL